MATRTDAHRPSVIRPEEYEFVAVVYWGPDPDAILAARDAEAAVRVDMERTGGTWSDHGHGGTCGICGACAHYLGVFHHRETNAYIAAGLECTANMGAGVHSSFRRMRRAVADAREYARGKARAQAVLTDLGLSDAWAFGKSEEVLERDENTVRDLVRKLVRYGSLSEKQIAFLRALLYRIAHRPEIEAKRAAERAAAQDVPEGAQTVTGVVRVTKYIETVYGPQQQKMLVVEDRGFRVWASVPRAIGSVEVGQRVRFCATLTRSEDDAKFGFGKRPTRAQIL